MNYENETYINGKDIWLTYNARLIHDSFTNLELPASRKPFVQNEARNQPGKQIFVNNPQPNDKEVQLTFLIVGENLKEFLQKKRKLVNELNMGWVELKVIPLEIIYKLTVDSYMSLDVFGNDNSGMLVVKFNEPNPKDRTSTVSTTKVLATPDGAALSTGSKVLTE